VIFRQIIHEDLGCASYLIGDARAGVAAVVDPKLDVSEYLRLADYMSVSIEHVLETHNHADHVSGHGRLAAATGATLHIHREAKPEYEHEPFDDGWELRLGALRVRALHTPGHRPEHSAFALIDDARGPEPWAVLTGDTLFVGDVARPDLAVEMGDGARAMFHSLHEGLLGLPATCEVWPGHLGGSMCGGPGMDMKVSSTIGYELAHQQLLQIGDEDEFVRRSTASIGPQPPNFRNIVALNRRRIASEGPTPEPLPPAALDGLLVVDVRSSASFDSAHLPGAVSVPSTHAGFGTRLAWIADGPLALVGRDDEDARDAAVLAAAVGVSIKGYLAGGMRAWVGACGPVLSTERLALSELHERWADGLQILDVREREEWRLAHIPGSVNQPYHEISGLPDGLAAERPIAVVCGSGQRAAVGASLVQRHGGRQVIHVVDGGVPQWRARGWPVQSAARSKAA
jgi:hydroxyacylglutathione hydrolase